MAEGASQLSSILVYFEIRIEGVISVAYIVSAGREVALSFMSEMLGVEEWVILCDLGKLVFLGDGQHGVETGGAVGSHMDI